VPVNWREGKISYFFEIGRGRVISELELNPDAPYPVYSSQTKNDGCLGFIDTYDFDDNILTWTTDGANAGTVFIRSGKFNCTNVCGTLKPKVDVDLKYYLYYLQTMTPFYKRPDTNGAKIMNNEMARIYCLIPPIQEQTKITQYLDHQTAVIDQLIRQKEKLIELLKEKRQAVINETVTKGLNPNAKMKDSGVEWLGEVPEEWIVSNLKRFAKIKNGKDQKPVQVEEGGYPVLGTGGEFGRASEYLYDKPSVLLGRKGTIDKPQYIDVPFWTVDTLFYTEIYNDVNPNFFYFLCLIIPFHLLQESSAVPSMTQDNLNAVKLCKPPLDEQCEIVDFLNHKLCEYDIIITKSQNQIEKLKEYRQSIISEAVTGKIDVRDWQPNKKQVA
jgi:type I restriction enzyme S subunit